MKQDPKPGLTLLAFLAPLALSIAAALSTAGCSREEPIPVPSSAPEETVDAPQKYELVATIASGLDSVSGIAVDAEDRLYVVGKDVVRVLDMQGEALGEWQVPGPATCIALGADGSIYIGRRTRIEVYDGEGKLLRAWGEAGEERGRLNHVTAVVVEGERVYVADAGNRCIHVFDSTGDFIDEIGKRDPGAGVVGFVCPSPFLDLVLDGAGGLYATNPGRGRVERYGLDGTHTDHFGESGLTPDRFFGCCNPIAIARSGDGRIVTAEKTRPRVKVFDVKGKLLAFIGPRYFSEGAPGLDVALDSKERILVSDRGDGMIRVFSIDVRAGSQPQGKANE